MVANPGELLLAELDVLHTRLADLIAERRKALRKREEAVDAHAYSIGRIDDDIEAVQAQIVEYERVVKALGRTS